MASWFSLHIGLLDRCPAKLRKEIHNSNRWSHLWLRCSTWQSGRKTRWWCIYLWFIHWGLQVELWKKDLVRKRPKDSFRVLSYDSVKADEASLRRRRRRSVRISLSTLLGSPLQNLASSRSSFDNRPFH